MILFTNYWWKNIIESICYYNNMWKKIIYLIIIHVSIYIRWIYICIFLNLSHDDFIYLFILHQVTVSWPLYKLQTYKFKVSKIELVSREGTKAQGDFYTMSRLKLLLCLLLVLISFPRHETRSSPGSVPFSNKAKNGQAMMESAKQVLEDSVKRQLGRNLMKPQRSCPGGPDPRHH